MAQKKLVSFLVQTKKYLQKRSGDIGFSGHILSGTPPRQFFKLLKHVLLMQEARVTNKEDFEIKLLRFAFVAWHAQKLVKYIRKHFKEFAKKGFITIQRILYSDEDMLGLLQRLITSKT